MKMNKVKYSTFVNSEHKYETGVDDKEQRWMAHANHHIFYGKAEPGSRHGNGHVHTATAQNSMSVDFILNQLDPVHTHTTFSEDPILSS